MPEDLPVSVASSKAKLAGLVAHRGPGDPAIADARADLAAAIDERAVDDPAALARAARIVRIALERGETHPRRPGRGRRWRVSSCRSASGTMTAAAAVTATARGHSGPRLPDGTHVRG